MGVGEQGPIPFTIAPFVSADNSLTAETFRND